MAPSFYLECLPNISLILSSVAHKKLKTFISRSVFIKIEYLYALKNQVSIQTFHLEKVDLTTSSQIIRTHPNTAKSR
jgi:hypothetical protein